MRLMKPRFGPSSVFLMNIFFALKGSKLLILISFQLTDNIIVGLHYSSVTQTHGPVQVTIFQETCLCLLLSYIEILLLC